MFFEFIKKYKWIILHIGLFNVGTIYSIYEYFNKGIILEHGKVTYGGEYAFYLVIVFVMFSLYCDYLLIKRFIDFRKRENTSVEHG